MEWYLGDKIFCDDDIGNHIGFVYEIEEISSGKKYIGQKVFFNKVTKPPLKGKVNKRRSKKDSDWKSYYGSNDELKNAVEVNGVSNYNRTILRLCKSKAEMNYYELYEIITRGALLTDNYFNSWVKVRINKNQLKGLMNEN